MNKIHLLLIFSFIVLSSGIFLSVFWWFTYSFTFGSCKVLSYNIAPGMNCEFNSILDCDSSYCAHLFLFFQGKYNYSSFLPVSFHDDNINPYNCWNILPFADLKMYLQATYPIGAINACYINFEDRLILSTESFYKATKDMQISGIILMCSGFCFLVIYILSLYFLRRKSLPQYQVL